MRFKRRPEKPHSSPTPGWEEAPAAFSELHFALESCSLLPQASSQSSRQELGAGTKPLVLLVQSHTCVCSPARLFPALPQPRKTPRFRNQRENLGNTSRIQLQHLIWENLPVKPPRQNPGPSRTGTGLLRFGAFSLHMDMEQILLISEATKLQQLRGQLRAGCTRGLKEGVPKTAPENSSELEPGPARRAQSTAWLLISVFGICQGTFRRLGGRGSLGSWARMGWDEARRAG